MGRLMVPIPPIVCVADFGGRLVDRTSRRARRTSSTTPVLADASSHARSTCVVHFVSDENRGTDTYTAFVTETADS